MKTDTPAYTAKRVAEQYARFGKEIAAQICERFAAAMSFDPSSSAHYRKAAALIRARPVFH